MAQDGAQDGAGWRRMAAQDGAEWRRMAQMAPKWRRMAQDGVDRV